MSTKERGLIFEEFQKIQNPLKKLDGEFEKLARTLAATRFKELDGEFEKLAKTLAATPFKEFEKLKEQIKLPAIATAAPSISRISQLEKFDGHLASDICERLRQLIKDFEATLDNNFEVGLRLSNFGQAVIHVTNVGFSNPSLVKFKGHNEQGEPVELIQNISQVTLLLVKVKRPDITEPKRPIGFAKW